ncbi:hypothetical protein B0H16DRAFT_1687142 [Mycena metata]|uniref:F-box domain-containing protein n=1 Tax=Mycena metata TaxID=1033252 RepID=A0AAD7JNE2_9AGAR|nr:hypothetical protein B0H16DRAFT_1687142 [Mycena metata]
MFDKVPNELWGEVFCYLPRGALKNISLTRRTFFAISRRLLFTNFHFALGIRRLGDSSRTFAEHEAHALARLAFWSSNDIAPLVRSCTLSYYKGDDNMPLFGAFFERLPQFINLPHTSETGRSLQLVRLEITTSSGNLRGWRAAPGQQIDFSSVLLPVAVFHANPSWQSWGDKFTGPNVWLQSLSPDTLRELVVATAPLRTTQSFPHVHTLEMRVSSDLSNLDVLRLFPALRSLTLGGNFVRVMDARLQVMLPVLESYNGVQEILYPFLSRSTLTRITVHHCHPHDLINALRGVSSCANMTSLTITVDLHVLPTSVFDTEALEAICTLLPCVTWLSISVDGDLPEGVWNVQPNQVLNLLGNTQVLPRSLQHLIITWAFSPFHRDSVPPSPRPDFKTICANITGCCPALELFWLDAMYSLSRWRKSQGRVEEATAYTESVLVVAVEYRPCGYLEVLQFSSDELYPEACNFTAGTGSFAGLMYGIFLLQFLWFRLGTTNTSVLVSPFSTP